MEIQRRLPFNAGAIAKASPIERALGPSKARRCRCCRFSEAGPRAVTLVGHHAPRHSSVTSAHCPDGAVVRAASDSRAQRKVPNISVVTFASL